METELIQAMFDSVAKSITFGNILTEHNLKSKRVLDIGCGFGQYLKHFGRGSMGITSTAEEVNFGSKNNLNIIKGNAEEIDKLNINNTFDVIWANNLFEHLLSPHAFLVKLKTVSNADTKLILGVPVIPIFYFLTRFAFFRGMLASNHINFFNYHSLKLSIERAGWKVVAARPYIFKFSLLDKITARLAPHLYFVCQNDAHYKYPIKKIKEWEGEAYYSELLKINNG